MAEIIKVNGDTIASQQVGRELEWAHITVTGDLTASLPGTNASQTYLDLVRQVVDQFASITFVGEPTATEVVFGIEGADTLDLEGDGTFTAVEALIDAIPTLSGSAIALLTLTGGGLS